ncbi:YdeI/OmpD-associated family protein [Agrococcus sp. HG114]|uniref:YdeI/OmpD-associated family protein n=1 Tax=Agrococcus sp. HG114 TaxID=2969757 RepID=UPI00215B21A9|nr:YdeI/OmpD-associated family protein [Agrococcus sp. HG114]MCR8670787.1 YdeI/OmpD-associated family protein [Agrococcus sp. HG114]
MSELRLRTTIEQHGPAAAIVLTDDQVAALGGARNAPVTLTIGDATVRTRIGQMGGLNLLGLSRERREALGVGAGDEVDAVIALDTAERAIELPSELAAALDADASAKAAFEALPPSRRKEMARSIGEAKAAETRQRRLEKALAELAARA